MTGSVRIGSERNETCPSCGEWKRADAALCRACRNEQLARDAKGKLPPAWKVLALGGELDPAFGKVCPECGGYKANREARRCGKCAGRGDALFNTGRNESIVTFRHEPTGAFRTLHCVGRGVKAQVADGLARLKPPDEWVVETRSTPESILTDLKADERGGRHTRNPRRYLP